MGCNLPTKPWSFKAVTVRATCSMHGLNVQILPVRCCLNASLAYPMASQGAGRSRKTMCMRRSVPRPEQPSLFLTRIDSILQTKAIFTYIPMRQFDQITQAMTFEFLGGDFSTLLMVFKREELARRGDCASNRMGERPATSTALKDPSTWFHIEVSGDKRDIGKVQDLCAMRDDKSP